MQTRANDKTDISLMWCFAAVLGYAAFLFTPQVFNDGDTYLHVAVGEWILQHHSVPYTDPFSYTFFGKPWVAHEWFAETLMALAYGASGWDGVVIFCGAAFALTLWLLARDLSRALPALPLVITLVLVGSCLSPHLLARPHILVLPLMEIWAAALIFSRAHKAPSLWFAPLITLWANLHGSFIFAIALVIPFALEAILGAKGQVREALRDWGLFFAATLLAALITPYGWHGLVAPLLTMHMTQLTALNEWQSVNFSTLQPVEVAVMAALYVGLSRGIRIPVVRLLVLIVLLLETLQHVRFEMQLAIVGALLLAEPLAQGLAIKNTNALKTVKASAMSLACLCVLVLLLTVARISNPIASEHPDSIASPVSAMGHVPLAFRDKPVFNENAFAGYMIFKGIKPFFDSRAELYGDAFIKNYMQIMSPDRKRLEAALAEYHVQWVMVAAVTPIVSVMDTLPGWSRLYADNIAVIYARKKK